MGRGTNDEQMKQRNACHGCSSHIPGSFVGERQAAPVRDSVFQHRTRSMTTISLLRSTPIELRKCGHLIEGPTLGRFLATVYGHGAAKLTVAVCGSSPRKPTVFSITSDAGASTTSCFVSFVLRGRYLERRFSTLFLSR